MPTSTPIEKKNLFFSKKFQKFPKNKDFFADANADADAHAHVDAHAAVGADANAD